MANEWNQVGIRIESDQKRQFNEKNEMKKVMFMFFNILTIKVRYRVPPSSVGLNRYGPVRRFKQCMKIRFREYRLWINI